MCYKIGLYCGHQYLTYSKEQQIMEEKLRQLRESSLQAIREADGLEALDAVRVR